MHQNTASQFIPVYTDDKKIELSMQDDQAVIRLSEWVDGLGWCGQKTMALDAEMLDELHGLIAAARLKFSRDAAEIEDDERVLSAKVLEFPKFA